MRTLGTIEVPIRLLGKDDEALASFGRQHQLIHRMQNPGTHRRIYDNEGDLDSAIKAYNRATEINPNYQNAWFNKDRTWIQWV